MPVLVEKADVAGVHPAVADGVAGRLLVVPIALHDQIAAHQDFTVIGDLDLDAFQGRADGVEFHIAGRIDADRRRSFRLPVALQDAQAQRRKEQPDFRVQWRAAGDHCLEPPAEASAHLVAYQLVQQVVFYTVNQTQSTRVLVLPGAQVEGGVEHFFLQTAGFAHA